MESSLFKFLPIGVWAFSAATSIIIVIIALYLYIFYRKRLTAVHGINKDAADLINLKQQLEQDVKSIRDWITNQKDELLKLEAERKEQEAIRAELQRLEQECAKKDKDNAFLRDEVGELETRKHLLDQKIETFEEDIKKISDEIDNKNSELDQAKKDLQKLKKEFSKHEKDKEELDKQIKDATKELAQITKKVDELESEKQDLKKSISSLKDEIDKLKGTIKDHEKEIKELKKEKKTREEDVRELGSRKLELSGEVQSLADKLKRVGTMPPEAFDSLSTPVFTAPYHIKGEQSEQIALEKLYELTEISGFTLPRRLQNAFHTALKTSDISCLTVMAGVSGTGKSAFPKLYAQSMGIHFLPLAVEPRWDSPHDLFGFLNYMDNRYEATTLGRALVQFNNSKFSNNGMASLNDQVLIVMLDEMNLARIEYYFSEFLSKLEMRRNIDLSNETDYRMVSAEVFAGYPGDKDRGIKPSPPVYLYAGSNVLFVGTMNEDETTQSLSDKVIDRANVIYFGQPHKLEVLEQKVPSKDDWQPISYNNWRQWIVEPKKNGITDFNRINEITNRINSTLAKLGRPFGWRTYKAILTYVANYPGVRDRGESGIMALADQIAMRVMPKLRGLDLAEYADLFSILSAQINDINDPTLAEAFSKANSNTLGFFDWRGISWE